MKKILSFCFAFITALLLLTFIGMAFDGVLDSKTAPTLIILIGIFAFSWGSIKRKILIDRYFKHHRQGDLNTIIDYINNNVRLIGGVHTKNDVKSVIKYLNGLEIKGYLIATYTDYWIIANRFNEISEELLNFFHRIINQNGIIPLSFIKNEFYFLQEKNIVSLIDKNLSQNNFNTYYIDRLYIYWNESIVDSIISKAIQENKSVYNLDEIRPQFNLIDYNCSEDIENIDNFIISRMSKHGYAYNGIFYSDSLTKEINLFLKENSFFTEEDVNQYLSTLRDNFGSEVLSIASKVIWQSNNIERIDENLWRSKIVSEGNDDVEQELIILD